MEVLSRGDAMCASNTEATTPPQPLHKRGQYGGGRNLRECFALIYCIL